MLNLCFITAVQKFGRDYLGRKQFSTFSYYRLYRCLIIVKYNLLLNALFCPELSRDCISDARIEKLHQTNDAICTKIIILSECSYQLVGIKFYI